MSQTSEKDQVTLRKTSRSHLVLIGIILSVLWALFFILTDVYLSRPNGLGEYELTTMHVLRSHLRRADFSAYTFDTGLGMSIYRLLPAGFGGILTIPVSLLPEKIHPELLAFLNALRLGISGACMIGLLQRVDYHLDHTSKRILRTLKRLLPFFFGLLYTIAAFLLCLLLHLPVADTFFLLPLLLMKQIRKNTMDASEQSDIQPVLSLSLLILFACFLCANTVWGLFLFPVPIVFLIIRRLLSRRSQNQHLPWKKQLLPQLVALVLAFLLPACLLLPQYMQFHYACGEGEPAATFLRQFGNDTDPYHTDVTFHSEATDILLGQTPTLLIAVRPTEESENTLLPESYSTSFDFLNTWFASLWPSLPIDPFQNATYSSQTYTVPATQTYSLSNLFASELYCAVKLPQRQHPVEVYLNDRLITTISQGQGTFLIHLGAYQVGQSLTLRLEGETPLDLANVAVDFAYLNEVNWELYTQDATFGITNLQVESDGITAEATTSSGYMLLTNIPYEKGWSLYFNGEKISTQSYQDAFLSADLPAGQSTLHLSYTAPGSTIGGWISGLTFLGLGIYFTRTNRRKTKE